MRGLAATAVGYAAQHLRALAVFAIGAASGFWVLCVPAAAIRKKLFTQRAQLKAAFNNMPEGVLTFDSVGRIAIVNRAFKEIYRLSPDVVLAGCSFRDLVAHGRAMGTFSGDVEEYCGNVFAAIAQNRTVGRVAELPNGRSIRVLNTPMPSGGWVSTHEEITEQRRAEQERDRNGEFLNLIIENVPVAICVKYASDRRYILVNRACELLWGVTRGQILGHTAEAFFSKDEAEQIKERDDQLLRSTEPVCHDQRPLMTVCHEYRRSIRRYATVREMKEDPSRSAIRC
jgi:PAS domain-containing protein